MVPQSDALCENVDPEAVSYKSKYEARKKLDVMVNKLEARRPSRLWKEEGAIPRLYWRLGHCRGG